MFSVPDKIQCVLWLAETKSAPSVQRKFRQKYKKASPNISEIREWIDKLRETGSIADRKLSPKNIKLTKEQNRERVQCVLWFEETKSLISVRRKFRQKFRKEAPNVNEILKWINYFKATGTVFEDATDETTSPGKGLVEETPPTRSE